MLLLHLFSFVIFNYRALFRLSSLRSTRRIIHWTVFWLSRPVLRRCHYLAVPLPAAEQGDTDYFLFEIADLMKHKTVEVKENPYSTPEINLFLLLDSYSVKYCIVPSVTNGIIKIAIFLWKVKKGASKKAIKCPTAIPVHLAHRGNWYPLKKKLLSGIWWQLQYFLHHSIDFIHNLSLFL